MLHVSKKLNCVGIHLLWSIHCHRIYGCCGDCLLEMFGPFFSGFSGTYQFLFLSRYFLLMFVVICSRFLVIGVECLGTDKWRRRTEWYRNFRWAIEKWSRTGTFRQHREKIWNIVRRVFLFAVASAGDTTKILCSVMRAERARRTRTRTPLCSRVSDVREALPVVCQPSSNTHTHIYLKCGKWHYLYHLRHILLRTSRFSIRFLSISVYLCLSLFGQFLSSSNKFNGLRFSSSLCLLWNEEGRKIN